jgi:hypothetical protein
VVAALDPSERVSLQKTAGVSARTQKRSHIFYCIKNVAALQNAAVLSLETHKGIHHYPLLPSIPPPHKPLHGKREFGGGGDTGATAAEEGNEFTKMST